MTTHLILGGARSGKSRFAEQCALASGWPVRVIVTATAGDDEMHARIAHHRASRPAGWRVTEVPAALPESLVDLACPGVCVIVDCLTLWLSNLLCALADASPGCPAFVPDPIAQATTRLVETVRGLPAETRVWLVANEVGFGIVPDNPLARRFRDEAGRLNQRLATVCDQVTLVVAGLPLALKPQHG